MVKNGGVRVSTCLDSCHNFGSRRTWQNSSSVSLSDVNLESAQRLFTALQTTADFLAHWNGTEQLHRSGENLERHRIPRAQRVTPRVCL